MQHHWPSSHQEHSANSRFWMVKKGLLATLCSLFFREDSWLYFFQLSKNWMPWRWTWWYEELSNHTKVMKCASFMIYAGLQHFDELVDTLEKALSGERHGDYITQGMVVQSSLSSDSHMMVIWSGYSNEVDSIRGKIQLNHKKTSDLVSSIQSSLSIARISVVPHKSFFRVLEVTKAQTAKAEKSPDLIRQGS